MTKQNFTINISSGILTGATFRARSEGKSPEQVAAELITAYAKGEPVGRSAPGKMSLTPQTITVDLPDSILLAAHNRIQSEGKSSEQVLVELITGYAKRTAAQAPPETKTKKSSPSPTSKQELKQAQPTRHTAAPGQAIEGEEYSGTLRIEHHFTDRPADIHADLNLALRGYAPTNESPKLIDLSGATDGRAPQLYGLFKDKRTPEFTQSYQICDWQWGPPPDNPGQRGKPLTKPYSVTLLGMKTRPGETIHTPQAGYEIGQGYQVMVLYADQERITLKYGTDDTVATGYAIHIENISVEPRLLKLYTQQGHFKRSKLPALRAGQAFGRARGDEIKVAIRDTGRCMDPRTRKDWWSGR